MKIKMPKSLKSPKINEDTSLGAVYKGTKKNSGSSLADKSMRFKKLRELLKVKK